MLAQYVYPSKLGLFRIVRHGRRWRSLLDECEQGRHDAAESALDDLLGAWPAARLPRQLSRWRYLPGPAAAPVQRARRAVPRWRLAG